MLKEETETTASSRNDRVKRSRIHNHTQKKDNQKEMKRKIFVRAASMTTKLQQQ